MNFITKRTKGKIGLFSSAEGSILILIVLLVALLAFIPIGTKLVEIARKQVKLQANAYAQATNMAQSGLTDAEAWFRMQSKQPVSMTASGCAYPDAAFYPRQSTNTATTDTLDESIGLVKTMKLGDFTNLWGRYEVVRQSTNNVTLPSSNYARAVHDVSALRVVGANAGDGVAWYVESVGYVYELKNSAVAYNCSPNILVGRSRVSTELRRMSLTTYPAAVSIIDRSKGNVGTSCSILGGSNGYGVAYVSGSGGTWTGVSGYGTFYSTATFNLQSVFGMPSYNLKMIADYSVPDVSQLPPSYPSTALVFVDGNATFDDTHPLTGGGILIVNGNLTVASTANAYFSGLVFVQGAATINGPADISGALMVVGSGASGNYLTVTGTAGAGIVEYDKTRLDSIRQNIGQYRMDKSAYHVFSALDNAPQ
jgi:hypothetical protein